ncbi:MAG: hypothetical protein KTR24_12455 [Saprospiraceae bacterium]|nr:hypothetical protein [Saprospiraceae bacterium]
MKTIQSVLLLLVFSGTMTGCLKDQCEERRTFVRSDPVYIGEAELHGDISVGPSTQMENPGIIYIYKNYLLINELYRGIHILDNSDPTAPSPLAFINIPGNQHFAVIENQLQANRYNALVTIDISNPQQAEEKSRIENAFEELYFHEGRGYLAFYRMTDQQQVLDCADPNFNSLRWQDGVGGPIFTRFDVALEQAADFRSGGVPGNGNVGVGGSSARFTIAADHLYAVNDYQMKVYDLEDPCRPESRGEVNLGWGIETIYPFKNKLFIGSNSGMFIYSIDDPAKPLYETAFSHATACDPVVADDNTAYVTLRDGSACQGFENQLDVIDVSDVTFASLIKSYKMRNPHGLAIRENFLYICEGKFGLKILDRTKSHDLEELSHLKDMDARDIIVLSPDHAVVTGREGIYQLDLSKPRSPKELSFISTL